MAVVGEEDIVVVAFGVKPLEAEIEGALFSRPRRCFRSTSETGRSRSSIEPRSIP